MSTITESGIRANRSPLSPGVKFTIAALSIVLQAILFIRMGLTGLTLSVVLPAMAAFVLVLYRYPKFGIFFVAGMGYVIPFMGRYGNPDIPWGLSVDLVLVLTYLMVLLKHWHYTNFRLAMNSITLAMIIWYGYIALQIINPEAHSIAAWFYVMRAMGLYAALIMPLCFILFNSKKDWKYFLYFWIAMSGIAILWAFKMHFIGLSATEQAWLDGGAHVTHVLFGKLRNFSFYSDAGTFGADMGRVCIMTAVMFLGPFAKKKKILFLIVALTSFYALMLSGTRGALAVPAIGGVAYLIMVKNIRLITIGAIVLALGFGFLKYTHIGHSNYQIYRLRSALDPNDPSLQVRLENRERLSNYLEGKPFGGGLGTTGVWGLRFSPNTWLAHFPPDGLYTRIRAETGVVGKYLYLGVWLFILYRGIVTVWKMKNERHKAYAMGILSGFAGLMIANYGNEVMTQVPISLTTYVFLTFVFSMAKWNEEGEVEVEKNKTPKEGALYPDKPWNK